MKKCRSDELRIGLIRKITFDVGINKKYALSLNLLPRLLLKRVQEKLS